MCTGYNSQMHKYVRACTYIYVCTYEQYAFLPFQPVLITCPKKQIYEFCLLINKLQKINEFYN